MTEETKAENDSSSSEVKSFENIPVKIEVAGFLFFSYKPCLLTASLEQRQIRIKCQFGKKEDIIIPFVQISDIVECDDYTIEFVQRMRIHRLHVNKKEDIHYLRDCKKMVDLFWTTGLHKLQKEGKIPIDETKPLIIDDLNLDEENNNINDENNESKPKDGPVPPAEAPEGLGPPKEAFVEEAKKEGEENNNNNDNQPRSTPSGEEVKNENDNPIENIHTEPKDDNLQRTSIRNNNPVKLEPLNPPGQVNENEKGDGNDEEVKE